VHLSLLLGHRTQPLAAAPRTVSFFNLYSTLNVCLFRGMIHTLACTD
jgi:hypothetical protein